MHCKSAHQKAGMFFVDVLGVVEGGDLNRNRQLQ